MDEDPHKTSVEIPWRKVAAFTVFIAAVVYAVEHPHSPFYYLVKFIALPVP
ncbi:hypothetical protein SAMN05421819_0784 [Bryocella elongata]|uniref:Uncharacterized protein n=1 Tax=Bryocella elongata TaxID=863522 RepID=A0A1H5TXX2_9BACT|nr:hypothetical protein SAMN05421819_0784 [Bryocella elongata]